MENHSCLHKVLYLNSDVRKTDLRLTITKGGLKLVKYSTPFLIGRSSKLPVRISSDSDERRIDNLQALRQTVWDLVDCNNRVYGYEPVFLTFTFAENVTDLSFAWKCWNTFVKKFQYKYFKLKYLTVVEFQQRGAVHFHAIFFNLPLEFEMRERKERIIANLWGEGYVDVERVRSAKNVASYVTSYLDKSANDKRLLKQKFFSTSKGLYRPEIYYDNEIIKNKIDDLGVSIESISPYKSLNGNLHYIYRFDNENNNDIVN